MSEIEDNVEPLDKSIGRANRSASSSRVSSRLSTDNESAHTRKSSGKGVVEDSKESLQRSVKGSDQDANVSKTSSNEQEQQRSTSKLSGFTRKPKRKTTEIETQTEWSWLRDLQKMEKVRKGELLTDTETEILLQSKQEVTISSDDESEIYEDEPLLTSKTPLLDSVGPPKILQYIPERKKVELISTDMTESEARDIEKYMRDFNVFIKGNHPCEFCGTLTIAWPTIEQQETLDPKELYCCTEYREYVESVIEIQTSKKQVAGTEVINIMPHPKSMNKKERRLAKQRAEKRALERQLEKQRKAEQLLREQEAANAHSQSRSSDHPDANDLTDASHSTLDNYKNLRSSTNNLLPQSNAKDKRASRASKQVRSISYQLSNLKFIKDGWTVRLPSPFDFDDVTDSEEEADILVPVTLPSAQIKMFEKPLLMRYYKTGQLCLILFPDGTGNVYYESGRLAITISLAARGMHIFTAFSDDENSIILALFDPFGNAFCNYLNGKLRLQMNPIGAIEFEDEEGQHRRKRWLWWDSTEHVHAPPFQPLIFMLNENIGIKMYTQQKIYMDFSAETQACNFRVGSRLQLIKPESVPSGFKTDSSEAFLFKRKTRLNQILKQMNDIVTRDEMNKRGNTRLPRIVSRSGEVDPKSVYQQYLNKSALKILETERKSKSKISSRSFYDTKPSSKASSRFVIVP